MTSRIIKVEPFDLVVFGGTGDLAYRKLYPGAVSSRQGANSSPTRPASSASRAAISTATHFAPR